jgi:DAD family
MYVGAVQFVYACLTGGYPFNSFLAGFAAAVGQFVLAGKSLSLSATILGLGSKLTLRSEFEESG